jgi:hypothetical protein
VPADLEKVCLRMLERDRRARFQPPACAGVDGCACPCRAAMDLRRSRAVRGRGLWREPPVSAALAAAVAVTPATVAGADADGRRAAHPTAAARHAAKMYHRRRLAAGVADALFGGGGGSERVAAGHATVGCRPGRGATARWTPPAAVVDAAVPPPLGRRRTGSPDTASASSRAAPHPAGHRRHGGR